ncbi:two component transcriptional regulator, LytTR family [Ekhidna lutea]|uniref:Two component transcriptional regulator, LytTR family n=1 Tax=Ekhidna lutea TaxID=447679 RepID=A0A239HP73_EKHLU|nr:LytTR family DNA-binding domain-containing protein [Ekhidna lutea]SNS83137.1 two component transcriptional regulator, LytTR family [Ekhidna lutea]
MKCVAIDDEVHALKVIELHAEKVEKLEMAATFTDPVQAADFLEKNRVDLIFLDINMQSLNGFELLESLTQKPQVIFTTAYSEYAVKSYSVDALDYLMKPISFSRFLKAVNKADTGGKSMESSSTDQIANQERVISVKSGTTIHRINLNDLLYLEADGNYTKFVTDKESIMVLCTMKDALSKVDDRFIQTHRSYAVATSKVNKVEAHQLRIGDKTIPIGSSYRKEVLEKFSN